MSITETSLLADVVQIRRSLAIVAAIKALLNPARSAIGHAKLASKFKCAAALAYQKGHVGSEGRCESQVCKQAP